MLLRNESRVLHTIDIKLVFDDDKVRELKIAEGDTVQVSYRKNGCIARGTGVIRNIKPYVHTKKFPHICCMESAIITLDMSEDLIACVDKIDLYDIIDIRKVAEFIQPIIPDNSGDFEITVESCENCPCNKKEEVDEEENPETEGETNDEETT